MITKKRKYSLVLLSLVLILSACGGSDTAEEEVVVEEVVEETLDSPATTAAPAAPAEPTASVGVVYDIGGRGDLSFNDMAYAGLEKAIMDLGVDGIDLEPNEGGENRPELLSLLADQGKDLIIGVGFLFADAMTEVATANPDISLELLTLQLILQTYQEWYLLKSKDLS
jgi:basic membrane lipoprotein Med (substrate-binding protein (PBP1-ABC) superfamily)